jgi:hypothetical protein
MKSGAILHTTSQLSPVQYVFPVVHYTIPFASLPKYDVNEQQR